MIWREWISTTPAGDFKMQIMEEDPHKVFFERDGEEITTLNKEELNELAVIATEAREELERLQQQNG